MSAIGPGGWVECCPPADYVGNERSAKYPVTVVGRPKPGGIYLVREVGDYLTDDGLQAGLRLVGVTASYPGHPDCWWNANCFRPIYRPKAEIIESLLQPAPELEPA